MSIGRKLGFRAFCHLRQRGRSSNQVRVDGRPAPRYAHVKNIVSVARPVGRRQESTFGQNLVLARTVRRSHVYAKSIASVTTIYKPLAISRPNRKSIAVSVGELGGSLANEVIGP